MANSGCDMIVDVHSHIWKYPEHFTDEFRQQALESINALNIALQKYDGTVLLVTHDHDLVEEVATRIWYFENRKIEDFKGPYADYLTEKETTTA